MEVDRLEADYCREGSVYKEEVELKMLTSFQPPFHTHHIDRDHAHGERDDAEADNDPPIDDQGSDAINQTSEESQIGKFDGEYGSPQKGWVAIVQSLVCVDVGRNVNVFFYQVEVTSWVVVEFLIPIKTAHIGIAQNCARGETDTSKYEEIILDLQMMMSSQLQDEARHSCKESKAIKDTD